MELFSFRDQVIEAVNKLFVFTDHQQWDKLQDDVFTELIYFDMSSLGGAAKKISAKEVCAIWQKGFEGIDAINHLAGNYLVTMNEYSADVFAYATATHYKKSATQGQTREYVGTYNLHLIYTSQGWRIDAFKYNLKYMTGNAELK